MDPREIDIIVRERLAERLAEAESERLARTVRASRSAARRGDPLTLARDALGAAARVPVRDLAMRRITAVRGQLATEPRMPARECRESC
jgi:hypothetical protein